MDRLIDFSDGENNYRVPEAEVEAFKASVPNARRMSQFVGKDGSRYSVPEDELESFKASIPDAEAVNRFQLSNGERYTVQQSRMSKFLRSREYREGDADAIAAKRAEIDAATPKSLEQSIPGAIAKGAFDTAESALKGGVRTVGKYGRAFTGMVTDPLRLAGMILGGRDNALVKGADWVNDKWDWFAEDLGVGKKSGSAWQDGFSSIGEIGTSGLASIMPWLVGGGVASKGARMALKGVNSLAAGGSSSTDMYDELKADGADEATAFRGALTAGAVSTAFAYTFGTLSAENFLKGAGAKEASKLIAGEVVAKKKGFNEIVRSVANGRMRGDIMNFLAGAAEEGVTEGAESFVLNVLKQHGSGEDVDLEEALLKALPDAAAGAALGGVMTGARAYEWAKNGGPRKFYEKQARAEVSQLMNDMAPGDIREMNPKAFDAAAKKRRLGGTVSRKDGEEIGLPPNWTQEQRNEVLDEWNQEQRNEVLDEWNQEQTTRKEKRAKMDGQQEMALREDIKGFVGEGPEAQRVYDRVTMELKDASILDDPYQREKLVMQAAEAAQRAENDAQERTNAEMTARESKRYDDFMLAREEARAKGGKPNETGANETQQKPDEAQSVTPPAGEEARPVETGKTSPEVGREVEIAQPTVEAPASASTETQANTPPTTTESAGGGSDAAESATKKTIPTRNRTKGNESRFSKGDKVVGAVRVFNPGVTTEKVKDVSGIFRGMDGEKALIETSKGNLIRVAPTTLLTPEEFDEYTKFTEAQTRAIAERMNEGFIEPSEIDRLLQMTPDEIASAKIKFDTKPKTVKEGKAFVNSNIGKRYTDGKKTYEITGLTKDGEVSVKVTDKIGKSSETTLKLSGTLTNIFGTKKKNAVWSEVKVPDSEQKVPKTEIADKKTARVAEKAEVKKPTKPLKANPKKAAEVVKEFASKDESRPFINHIHHDHDSRVAVATDGRILIATKHGYDPNYKINPDAPFPNWRQVVPIFKKGEGQTVTIDPNSVLEATKTFKKLASGIKAKDMIRIKLPNGEHTFMSVNTLSRVAKAMAANGITEITTEGPFKPLLAKNNDTTIVAMPMRHNGIKSGRNDVTDVVTFDLETGKVISAPESKISKMRRDFAEKLRADIAEGRAGEKELAKLEKEIAAEDAIDALMADAEPTPTPKGEPKAEAKAEVKEESETKSKSEVKEPKSEAAPTITPAEAMKKLGSLGAADVDTLSKALAREERAGHTERANMIRVLRDYKRGVGTNPNPQSDETSGGKYRASVEAAKPLDDPAFLAWAKKRGVAPTTQKRNEYDKAMADTLKNRLSRWIKGVSVKTVNFIAPEEGGDVRHSVKQSDADSNDAAYLDAVKRGDMETAQRMVREAAAKAMPNTKVLDDDGLPRMVYHGTYQQGFTVFKAKDEGVYTSSSKENAEGYSFGAKSGVYDLFVNAKNPLVVDAEGSKWSGMKFKGIEKFKKALNTRVISPADLAVYAREHGYDGVIIKNVFDGDVMGDDVIVYQPSQIKSADAVTYDDNGNVIPLSQRFNPENNDIRYLHDGERIVGSYNRATGEVKLAKGASVETVLHELGWHAARHWAEVNADSDQKAANLLNQMKEYAESAPKEIKDAVRDTYGEMSADTLLDEIGAARFTKEQSGKIAKAIATKEGAAWYQKVWNKVVDFYKNFLTKIGYNRVDLDGIEYMSPDVFGDFLADVMMSGKQLGERTAFSMEAPKGLAAKWTTNLSDYKAPIAELEKRTTGSSNNIYYLARTLEGMAQRGKNRAERAIKRVEKILGEDISPELLAQYMQLKAYEERNAKIERRNGKADASGMTPEDARAIEKTIEDSGVDEATFEEAAQILWDLQKEGLQARVDAGLLKKDVADEWMTDEPHHIPWKDAVDPDSGEYVGRRMGASEFDTAEGRKTAASGDPITWMLQEYQDAMTRAAQNRLRSSIANLTRLNGDVGTVYDGIQTDSKGKRSFIKYPKGGGKAKVLSIPEGAKIESTVKNDGGMKNVLTFKEGGETKYLVLNGTLGEAVAGAVTGRTLARPPAWISWTMRGYAATATALSPTFAARNITADNFDIHNNLVAKYGWVKGEKMFGKIVKAQALMTKQLGSYIKNGDFKLGKDGKITDFQKLVESYEDAGGLIGGMATEGYDATVKKIQADFRAGRNKARSIGKSVATYWTIMQRMSELAPRLAVFKTAMESGMSAKDAAMLSRDITVDFNKKGRYTPWFNTLFMFSNSALGANLTQMKGLAGKTGAKLAGGLVMYGFAEGMLEALMNGDDDEREKEGLASGEDINEYTRQNSLYVRKGDKVFRVNIHMGPFAYAKYFGNVMARTFSGMISPEKAAKELGLTAAEVAASFTGLGNVSGDALVQTAVPTVLQPFVQMATNKDYAGRAVYRTKFTESKPDSAHGRKSTAAGYHWAASFLNSLTGGNEARKGAIDIAPETVKMLTEMVGKNFARDISEIAETGYKLLSGNTKDLDVRNVPIVGDFARTHEGNDNRFYENYNRYRDDKYELKNNSELKGDERRAYLKEHPWLYSAGKPGVTRIDNIVKRIEKLRDVEESDRATEERKAEAKAARRKLQARVIEIMTKK